MCVGLCLVLLFYVVSLFKHFEICCTCSFFLNKYLGSIGFEAVASDSSPLLRECFSGVIWGADQNPLKPYIVQ